MDMGPGLLPPTSKDKEREPRISSFITMSKIEAIIYSESSRLGSEIPIIGDIAIGRAIDWFLVPANFIYRFRDNYCFPPQLYPEWDLRSVFSSFYPTGYGYGDIVAILEKHRPNFWGDQNPLKPANLALERRNIKDKLIPVWQEIARKFEIDSFGLQEVMEVKEGQILPTERTASEETIAQIGIRIVRDRFDALVDDDKNYTYVAQPDCLLVCELAGQTFHIQVKPDYIKRLREKRKTTAKRHIIIKRIVGDFKDSDRRDLADFSTPFGRTMLVYNWLLSQIGEKLKWDQLTWVRLTNGQRRRVFLIPQEVRRPFPAGSVLAALEFLREDGGEIFSRLPQLSEDSESLARNTLERALLLSQKSRLAT